MDGRSIEQQHVRCLICFVHTDGKPHLPTHMAINIPLPGITGADDTTHKGVIRTETNGIHKYVCLPSSFGYGYE